MSVPKTFFALFLSLILISGAFAQQTVEKTLVKSFNLQGNDLVDLNLSGDVQIKEWNSPAIRVEMLITLENGNETMLKSLIRAGRYNLTSEQTEDSFQVNIFGLDREVLIKGDPLQDNVSYIVSIPSGTNIRETIIASAELDK